MYVTNLNMNEICKEIFALLQTRNDWILFIQFHANLCDQLYSSQICKKILFALMSNSQSNSYLNDLISSVKFSENLHDQLETQVKFSKQKIFCPNVNIKILLFNALNTGHLNTCKICKENVLALMLNT